MQILTHSTMENVTLWRTVVSLMYLAALKIHWS